MMEKGEKVFIKKDDPEEPTKHVEANGGGDAIDGDKIIMGDDKSTVINASDNATVQQIENQTNIYNPKDPTPASLHQIPAPPQDFTGREEELAQLCQAVQNEGVVLSGLRGMGGVGKTALALVLSQRLAPDYPDAQIFVNMFGSTDTATPPTTAAAVMGSVIRAWHPTAQLPEDQNQLAALYNSVLHEKKALILLDDARDRAQVEPLLPPATCLLLVTTRQRFSLPGLKELDLDTMSEAESVELIEKITPRAGKKAGEIAAACGHLPLALRLAASALREQTNLTVENLLARLTDAEKRFTTLKEVHAAIQVSYDLLTEDLQSALRQLAVFPADFDQLAAAAVWNVDADTAPERLAVLMNASLVDYNTESGRYRLHDLVCAGAENLLEGDERTRAAYRHAAHFMRILAITDHLYLEGGDKIMDGLSIFDREWDNIKIGQAWAVNNAKIKETAQLCINYPYIGIYCLTLRLIPRKHIQWLEDALSAAREIGDRHNEGKALGNLGNAYVALGQYHQAIKCYEQISILFREIGDRRGEGTTLGNLGIANKNLGQYQQAINYHQQALVISREIGDRRGEGQDIGNLGLIYANLGQYQQAIELYHQRLEIAHEIGDRRGEGIVLGNLGLAFADLGQYQQAIDLYHQRLKIAHEIGDRRGEEATLGNLGIAYTALDQYQKGIEQFKQHLEIAREIGDRRGEGNALGNLATLNKRIKKYKKAIGYYQQSLKIAQEIGDRRSEALTGWNLGDILAEQGKLKEAIPLMQMYVDFETEIGHPDAEKDAARVKELKGNL